MIELPLTDEAEAYGKRVKREYDRRGVTNALQPAELFFDLLRVACA